jgi:hypothetical protein
MVLMTLLFIVVAVALNVQLFAQGKIAAASAAETQRLLSRLVELETTKQANRVPGSGIDQIRERLIIRAAAKAAKAKANG